MSDLGVQFVARSGMEEAVGSGMLQGRPFGGVSIAWAPELHHAMKPLVNYRHKRLVCVEMAAEPKPILFISIYMPFFDSSKRTECLAETMDAIAMVEEILSDHPLHQFVLGGDFNTEFNGHSPFDNLWKDCISRQSLLLRQPLQQQQHQKLHIYTSVIESNKIQ